MKAFSCVLIFSLFISNALYSCQTCINEFDPNTLLFPAAKENNRELVKHILTLSNVDINTQDKDGRTPLMEACYRGHEVLVQLLIKSGANLDIQEKYVYKTALMGTIESLFSTDNVERDNKNTIIKLLVNGGADLTIKDRWERTALKYAQLELGSIENLKNFLYDYEEEKKYINDVITFLQSPTHHTSNKR